MRIKRLWLGVAKFLTAIYKKSRRESFLLVVKKGEAAVRREKEIMRELGGWERLVRFGVRSKDS